MLRTSTMALGALALSAISYTALARVHVVFTDVKFDDKVALKYLLEQKEYDRFLVVYSGLKDMKRANGDLHDFLAKAALGENADTDAIEKFTLENVKFVTGGEFEAAPHEAKFLGSERDADDTFENIINSGFFKDDDYLNVTQIAPTPMKYIKDLADKFNFDRYHLVHGYNSKQEIDAAALDELRKQAKDVATFERLKQEANEAAQLKWLKELKSTVRQKSAEARVVVTNNFASFVKPGKGSSHLFKAFDGKVPVKHLQSAVEDPFYANQMMKMDEFLKGCGVELGVKLGVSLRPSHKTSTPVMAEAASTPVMAEAGDLVTVEDKEKEELAKWIEDKVERGELAKWIDEARRGDKQSQTHFFEYVEKAIAAVKENDLLNQFGGPKIKTTYERFSGHVMAAFKPEAVLTVELCDANHVASVFKAEVAAYKPFEFVKDDKNRIIMTVVDDKPGDGLTLQGLDGATVLGDLIASFGGREYPTV